MSTVFHSVYALFGMRLINTMAQKFTIWYYTGHIRCSEGWYKIYLHTLPTRIHSSSEKTNKNHFRFFILFCWFWLTHNFPYWNFSVGRSHQNATSQVQIFGNWDLRDSLSWTRKSTFWSVPYNFIVIFFGRRPQCKLNKSHTTCLGWTENATKDLGFHTN